jgi:hypothetical protein
MGSFAVERFSIGRMLEIKMTDIYQRVEQIRQLVSFDVGVSA